MKTLLSLALLSAFSLSAHAENTPVSFECKTEDGGFVRSGTKSYGDPYYYNKKTLLETAEAKADEDFDTYIIQNEDFDLSAGVAHLTGEGFKSRDNDFELMMNFATGKGTLKHGRKKDALTKCKYERW